MPAFYDVLSRFPFSEKHFNAKSDFDEQKGETNKLTGTFATRQHLDDVSGTFGDVDTELSALSYYSTEHTKAGHQYAERTANALIESRYRNKDYAKILNPTRSVHKDSDRKRIVTKNRKGLIYFGLSLLLSAMLLYLFNPINAIIKWQSTFREDTMIFKLWVKPPISVSSEVYVFNYTNVEAFLRGEEKLKIQELGPYVYLETTMNNNVTFNKNNTFTYVPSYEIYEDPDNTPRDPKTEVITVPNLAFLGVASYLTDSSFLTNMAFNVYTNLMKSELFITMTVDDFVTGYEEPLLVHVNKFMPSVFPEKTFGFLDLDTLMGHNVVTSNANLVKEVLSDGRVVEPLSIDKYNGSPGLVQFGYDVDDNTTHLPCNTLQGIASDGFVIPRKINFSDKFYLYTKIFGRTLPIFMAENTTTSYGIPVFMANLSPDMFNNSSPDNACFCDTTKNKACLPDGISDVGAGFLGFPIGLSLPHFLLGDHQLSTSLDGLTPNWEQHNSYALFEPQYGVMVVAHVRTQFNLLVRQTRYNAKVRPMNGMVLPILWMDYHVKELSPLHHSLLYLIVTVIPIAHVIVLAILAVAGLAAVAVFLMRRDLQGGGRGRGCKDFRWKVINTTRRSF